MHNCVSRSPWLAAAMHNCNKSRPVLGNLLSSDMDEIVRLIFFEGVSQRFSPSPRPTPISRLACKPVNLLTSKPGNLQTSKPVNMLKSKPSVSTPGRGFTGNYNHPLPSPGNAPGGRQGVSITHPQEGEGDQSVGRRTHPPSGRAGATGP